MHRFNQTTDIAKRDVHTLRIVKGDNDKKAVLVDFNIGSHLFYG